MKQASPTTLINIFLIAILQWALYGCGESSNPRLQRYQHTDNGSYAAALSTQGKYAVVSTAQGITLWQVDKHLPKYVWKHQDNMANQVISVDISSDNSHVVTANTSQLALWNMTSGHNKGFWQVKDSKITQVKVSNQGQEILIAQLNGTIELYQLHSGRRLQFLGHKERISSIDMSANGHFVLSGSYDGKALFWNSKTGQVIHDFKHSEGRITKVALDASGQYAFTANSFKESFIWQLSSGKKVSQLSYPMRQLIFTSVVFSHGGNLLATGAPNRKIKLWHVDTGKLIAEWKYEADGFGATILDFAFSEDDKHLIAENSYGLAEVWDISSFLID